MTYKLKEHVTSEMLEGVGFKSYKGQYYLTRDIGVFCETQGENETLFVDLDSDIKRNFWGREISFNGGWIKELRMEDYIQDLIEKDWVEEV